MFRPELNDLFSLICAYCNSPHCRHCLKLADHVICIIEKKEISQEMKAMGVKHCPQCNVEYQRQDGCNAMKCARCTTIFCHRCGFFVPDMKYEDHAKLFGGIEYPHHLCSPWGDRNIGD